jgi:hypothetical protein
MKEFYAFEETKGKILGTFYANSEEEAEIAIKRKYGENVIAVTSQFIAALEESCL